MDEKKHNYCAFCNKSPYPLCGWGVPAGLRHKQGGLQGKKVGNHCSIAYLMRYCLICIFYFIFKTKCNTKSISLNVKIKLVKNYEDIYKGKKSPIHLQCDNKCHLLWSFSGLSSRIEILAHIPCCSVGSYQSRTVEIFSGK